MGDPLWSQCLAWLRSWSMVPPGLEVGSPGELVLLLRDGVILCQLVHCLDPTSVDMTQVVYTHHSLTDAEAVSDFVCRNNIFLFLSAAIKNFKLDHEHFFQPSDLYEAEDISMVLKTLSALSHTSKFTTSGKPGFPKKLRKLDKKMVEEEPLYEGLRGYITMHQESLHSPAKSPSATPAASIYSPMRKSSLSPHLQSLYSPEKDDYIYQSICSPRKPRPLLPSFSKKNKREFPLKEFLDSEEKYVGNLCMVRDTFQLQLQHMEPQVMRIVFFKLQDMIVLHSGILRTMKAGEKGVGQIVLENRDGFEIYKSYCTNLGRAMITLEAEEARNAKLKKELVKCQLAAKSPFPLSAHIVLPFQRLLKYHLLLNEVLKHTPAEHKEFKELEQAHNHMKNFNTEVNEAKRDQEDEEKQKIQDDKDLAILANVQRTVKNMRLDNNVRLQEFGRLRRAGELCMEGSSTDYVFLLDTVMLACNKPRLMQQRYRFKFSIKLSNYRVDTGSPQGTIRLLPRSALVSPLVLLPKSPAELDLWLRAILTCMDLLFPSQNDESGHEIQLQCLAGEGVLCTHCGKLFRGELGQGYRCRVCPAILHKACLAEQVCMEEVTMRRSASMALPTFLEREGSRSSMGSTLSIAPNRTSPRQSAQVEELQSEARRQQELLPLSQQDWWAGGIDLKTATERIKSLPTGTFLVRSSEAGENLAMDLKARNGVKHMKIYVDWDDSGDAQYSFSEARKFPTLPQLIGFYRTRDLLENFSYRELEGIRLSQPYKNV